MEINSQLETRYVSLCIIEGGRGGGLRIAHRGCNTMMREEQRSD